MNRRLAPLFLLALSSCDSPGATTEPYWPPTREPYSRYCLTDTDCSDVPGGLCLRPAWPVEPDGGTSGLRGFCTAPCAEAVDLETLVLESRGAHDQYSWRPLCVGFDAGLEPTATTPPAAYWVTVCRGYAESVNSAPFFVGNAGYACASYEEGGQVFGVMVTR